MTHFVCWEKHKPHFFFYVLLTVHFSIFILVINQLEAQNFCFTISLFHASTCFEHVWSNHVEAWNKLIMKQKFCASSWLMTKINISHILWYLGFFAPFIVVQLCNVKQQNAHFSIDVLIQSVVSSVCFEHNALIIRKTICTCSFLNNTCNYYYYYYYYYYY